MKCWCSIFPSPRAEAPRAARSTHGRGSGNPQAAPPSRIAGLAALAILATGAVVCLAPPLRAVTLERSLGRRTLEFRASAADSLHALPDRRILIGSDSVWLDGRLLRRGSEYTLTQDPSRLRLRPAPGDSSLVRVRYRYLPVPLADLYQLPGVWAPADVAPGSVPPPGGRALPGGTGPAAGAATGGAAGDAASGSLARFSVSGSKTLAFEVASRRDVAVQQSLDLSLGGELAQDLSVVAVLSDRNLALTPSGTTQDLGNLDKVVVEVKSPGFGANLGDFDLNVDAGAFGAVSRTVQGVRGHLSRPGLDVDAAAALSRGEFASRQFLGEEGRQGPYALTDDAGRTVISVVPGTEVVWLDGLKMRRGDDADYTIDYSRGEVTFTPRHPIQPGSRIAVDYQFSSDGFRRNLFASQGSAHLGNVGSLKLSWLREADDASQPSGGTLSADDLAALKAATGEGVVLTDGIHFVGAGKGDYFRIDPGLPTEHFQYVGRDSGDYLVDFIQDPQGQGAYAESLVVGGLAYGWRPDGPQAWRPGKYLPVPSSQSLGDLSGDLHLGALRLTGEGALSMWQENVLRNTPSSNGGAWNLGAIYAPEVHLFGRSLGKLEWNTQLEGRDDAFRTMGRSLAPFVEQEWNLSEADRDRGRDVETSSLKLGSAKGTSLGVEVGRWNTHFGRSSSRVGVSGDGTGAVGWHARWLDVASTDSLGQDAGTRRLGWMDAGWTRGRVRPKVHWTHDITSVPGTATGVGYDDVGGGVAWTPRDGLSAELLESWRQDTFLALPASQAGTTQLNVGFSRSASWSLTGSYSERRLQGSGDSLGTTRNALLQGLLHHAGFDGDAHYEISSARLQGQQRQVTFVGPGLGTYDSLGNYTGKGDYTVNQFDTGIEVPSQQLDLSTRLEWSGERQGLDTWLKHWTGRTEVTSSQSIRRAGGRSPLLVWPGSLVTDASVLRGTGAFRQDVEWAAEDGHATVRLRHEWTGDADRPDGGYGQVSSTFTESGRLRLAGTSGTSMELETHLVRREVTSGLTEGAQHTRARGSDSNLTLRWVPSARWTVQATGRYLGESDPDGGASTRQVEAGPSVAYSRGGRFRSELRLLRVWVSDEGVPNPSFTNFGTVYRSRLEHNATVTYQMSRVVQASVLAQGTSPDGQPATENARFEMRALF